MAKNEESLAKLASENCIAESQVSINMFENKMGELTNEIRVLVARKKHLKEEEGKGGGGGGGARGTAAEEAPPEPPSIPSLSINTGYNCSCCLYDFRSLIDSYAMGAIYDDLDRP